MTITRIQLTLHRHRAPWLAGLIVTTLVASTATGVASSPVGDGGDQVIALAVERSRAGVAENNMSDAVRDALHDR